MTIKELKEYFSNGLASIYPKEEILSFFYILMAYRLNLSKVDISFALHKKIDKDHLDFFKNAFKELKKEKPIQYTIGETEFYGLPFKVTKDVLIPRPETEELVDWILKDISVNSKIKNQKSKIKILDIGTGSGCIAISLAKNLPNVTVFALDISKSSLTIAKENAKLNDVKIKFIEQNILTCQSIRNEQKELIEFDIIVSNPPYVRISEKKEIKSNVLENEPHLALFVDNEEPLVFYNHIADIAKKQLTKNGSLYFEINQYLGRETFQLLKQKGYNSITLKKDLFNNDRMLKATY